MKRFVHLRRKLLGTLAAIGIYSLVLLFQFPCLYKAVLHISCPGCGMTRAWLSVLRGDLAAAFSFNPLFWTIPILYLYVLTDGHLIGRRWADHAVLTVLLGAFLVLAVLRLTVPSLWV